MSTFILVLWYTAYLELSINERTPNIILDICAKYFDQMS